MKILKFYQVLLIFFLISTTFIIFYPMLETGYANIDDFVLLSSYSGSLKDLSLSYIVNTFKHYHEGLYHPLVTLSYSLETTIFGFTPSIFHFDNTLLHIINIILVFIIFFKLSNSFWLSFIISALFAIHPTRAEVVCWISARKDLLYAVFYLLSVLSYLKIGKKKISLFWIIISVFFYLCSCLSKSMAITLPFTICLIDLYKDEFNKKKLLIYCMYILITFLFVLVTLNSHYSDTVHVRFHFDLFRQAINFISAHFNILFYLDKLFLPINLYCMYPYFYDEFASLPPWYIMYSPAILYILIYLSFLSLKKMKFIFYGFTFFLISIIPVSSVFPIGDFVVADRYTYIPYLGLFFIFAKIIIQLYKKNTKSIKVVVFLICSTIFLVLNHLTYNRVLDWQLNNYSSPRQMKFYEFGIKKRVKREITKTVDKNNNTFFKTRLLSR